MIINMNGKKNKKTKLDGKIIKMKGSWKIVFIVKSSDEIMEVFL